MDVKRQADRRHAMTPERAPRCWCSAAELDPLGDDGYGRCGSCGTVVFAEAYDPREYASSDPESFYGDRYWRRHVPERLGLPGLEERARSDLFERDVVYLTRILERLAPGARVLELGCGTGSLTYLLRVAGFDAVGVELGPAAIELARARFGLEVLRGPLETAGVEGDFDAVVAIDLLEHLPDPLGTLAACRRRLRDGGRLFVQTPRYRGEGPDWRMLIPREHLFLFTAESVERLLGAAGFAAVEVADSLFPHDMWVVAGRRTPGEARPDLVAGVAPAAVALIDAHSEIRRARAEREAIDEDRRLKQAIVERLERELRDARDDQERKERLLRRQDGELRVVREDQSAKAELIDRLSADLGSVRADQTVKAGLIEDLSTELASVRADQTVKAELIEDLSTELASVRGDQTAKTGLIEDLSAEVASMRGDQTAKAEVIERLSAELASVRADRTAKAEVIGRLSAELEAVRADQSAKAELIERLAAELETVRGDHAARGEVIERLAAELEAVRAELSRIRSGRLFRLAGALGGLFGRPRR